MLAVALLVLTTGSSVVAGERTGPELLCPSDETALTLTGVHRPPVIFSWRAADGGLAHRLLVAEGRDFDHPIVDRATTETSETVRGLPGGTYSWKVIAGDASSPVATFSLKYLK